MDELEALKSENARLRQLVKVSEAIHVSLDSGQALQSIISEAVKLVGATSGSVALVNPTDGFLEILASVGLPENATGLRLKIGEGVTGWVARHGVPVRVGNVEEDPRYIMVRQWARSEMAVPLMLNGNVQGVLNVDSDRTDAFEEQDQTLLEHLGLQASRVINNSWVFEQWRRQARMFEGLFTVAQTINSSVSLDDTLRGITREATLLMHARMGSLLLLDATGDWLELKAHHGAGRTYVEKPRLAVIDSFLGTVVRRRKPAQIRNIQTSGQYQQVNVARTERLVSLLSVPLIYQEQALGVLNVYTSSLHTFSNEEVRILVALADLSALAIQKARLYERIVGLEEDLRGNEKLSALGLLAAEVAHEIRNPLTVLKMLFQSLKLDYPDADPRSRDVRVIQEKMDHLNRTVEQILAFNRNTEPRPSTVDLNAVLEDLVLLVRFKLERNGQRLVQDLDPGMPPIVADGTQLSQAFLNLILNASEAMPGGGDIELVSRALSLPGQRGRITHVKVEVRDRGTGITPEHRSRLFNSLLNTTKEHGTGLGLAIVHKTIEGHEGRIRVRARRGGGTVFSVILPA